MVGAGVAAGTGALLALHMNGQWQGLTWVPSQSFLSGVVASGIAAVVFGVACVALLVVTNRPALEVGWRLARQAMWRKS